MNHILITGSSGGLGRAVRPLLRQAGPQLRLMSRRAPASAEWVQADLDTGAGLAEAVRGVDTILHCASSPASRTQAVDVEGTRRLLAAAKAAGVAHLYYISIVGIERLPLAYYRAKVSAEAVVRASGVPWTILRATQFHSLIDGLFQASARFPIGLTVPALKYQPIDTSEVAAHIAATLAHGAAGRLPDIGGPEVLTLGEMLPPWLQARQLKRLLIPVPLPGGLGQALRSGYNTCPSQKFGKITWAQWLQTHCP